MSAVSTTSSPQVLTGLFKEAYADKLLGLVPDNAILVKRLPFIPRDKENGNYYHQPVVVQNEQGFTYAIAGSQSFFINSAVGMTLQDAQIQGANLLLASNLSYEDAAKAANGKKAFVKGTELLVKNMMESSNNRLEIGLVYGQAGLGQIQSAAVVSGAQFTVTLTAASWAPGIWIGMEKSLVDFFNGNVVGTSTQLNTNTGSNGTQSASIVFINPNTYTITFNASGSTDASAIVSAVTSNPGVCTMAWGGAWIINGSNVLTGYNEAMGLKAILSATSTYMNINPQTYSLWLSNVFTVSSGALTFGAVTKAAAVAAGRGLNEDVVLLVNPITWQNLNTDLAALRMFDSSFSAKKLEQGSKSIEYSTQTGTVEIISHPCVKAGDAFLVPLKRMKRIGAQDIDFKVPGMSEDIFVPLTNQAGYQLRTYTNQALLLETPARAVYLTGFTNS